MTERAASQPWHHYVHAFRDALGADDQDAFRAALHDALSGESVIIDRENRLLIDGNADGRSYNAMGQSDMGLFLIRAGAQWDVPKWIEGGKAAKRVMLTDYEAGGLGLIDFDTESAWFAGKTSRISDGTGGTINKHLYAARQFLWAADTLEELGHAREAALYQRAGEAGLRKMVVGEDAPLLSDFFVRDQTGEAVLNAWVYYRLDNADPERPAYVRNDELNASYHTFDMKLIYETASEVGPDFDWAPFHAAQVDGLTAFGAMQDVVLNKIDSGGLDIDTPVPLGQFTRAPDGNRDLPSAEVTAWFETFLPAPDLEGTEAPDRLSGTAAGDSIVGHGGDDRIAGRAGDDRLRGADGSDKLFGGPGADRMNGGTGEDTLAGAAGDDVLIGGSGADVFAFLDAPGTDRVVDFGPGDRLAIDDRIFEGGGTTDPRALTASSFALADAITPETRVIYDPATGALSVDTDGSGQQAPTVLAILSGAPSVQADDFLLF